MDDRLFDALARGLAGRPTRRQALKLLAATVIGGAVPFRRSAAAADAPTPKSCARQLYTKGKHFSGKPIEADSEFFPSLDKIDACAAAAGVTVFVTNSYRNEGQSLSGTVVTPVEQSNHGAGHAIDMNVTYQGDDKKDHDCNSTCLADKVNQPKPVKDFIDCVKKAGLRWGGDFTKRDPVHIDDGLNVENPKRWGDRKKAVGDSTTCAACAPCDLGAGLCKPNCGAGKACDEASGTCKEKAACGTDVVTNPNGAGVCR